VVRTNIEVESAEPSLRPRICHGPNCGALFFVCSRCDRGQRYCSQECRAAARRLQQCAASRRYQRTEAGKEAHRTRQRSYRQRRCRPRVTHQGPQPVATAGLTTLSNSLSCANCGCQTRWVDPFISLGLRHRRRYRGRLPADARKTTFSDDRLQLLNERAAATAGSGQTDSSAGR
jgi:hypothetical protein